MFFIYKSTRKLLPIVLILLCSFLLCSKSTSFSDNNQCFSELTSLTDHLPIDINSNSDFVTLGFSGNGSSTNPYIIENLRIESTAEYGSGIEIGVTNVYFIIRNCEISSAYLGIRIQNNVASGTAQIIGNKITSISADGGGIGCSSETLIENNTISGFMQGIHLNEVNNCKIKGNNITQSYYQGINIRYSDYTEVTYNEIRNSNQHGVAIVGSSSNNNLIHHNSFINNSNEPTYRIDGERFGDITSQGYDEGSSNFWFDEDSKHGNWWGDYDGEGEYVLDGPSSASDKYPLQLGETARNGLVFYVSVLSLICLVWLIKSKNTSSK